MAILRIYLFLVDSFQPSDISTPEIENGNEYISWNFRNQEMKNILMFYILAAAFGPNLYISRWKFESCPTG